MRLRVVVLVFLLGGLVVSGGLATAAAVDDPSEPTDEESDRLVVHLDSPTETVTSAAELQSQAVSSQQPFLDAAEETEGVTVERSFWIVNAVVVEIDQSAVDPDTLSTFPNVDRVHADRPVQAADTVGGEDRTSYTEDVTPQQDGTYGLDMIRAQETWSNFGTQGEGVGVAVLDTGVDPDHEAIDLAGWAEFDSSGNEVDSDPSDADGHGTHVAGTVAGTDATGTAIGVAPEADLYGVKVLDDDGEGTFSQVAAGMEWAIEHEEIDILQMSLGTDDYVEGYIDIVQNARQTGHLVVAASGNDGVDTSSSPANVYDSLAVGAVNEQQDVPFFSSGETVQTDDAWSFPPETWPDEYVVPDVTAPGVGIESADAGTTTGTRTASGTSMAAPHVAGTAALVMSAAPELSDDEVYQAIQESADHPDGADTPDDRYGHGIIDSFAATALASSDATISGTITGDGEPLAGAEVISDQGIETVTDTDGSYTLFVAEGEQTITANAFGWAATSRTVSVSGGDSITEDFDLDGPVVDVRDVTTPPRNIESGDEFTIDFETINAENYTVELLGETIAGEPIPPDTVSISVDSEPVTVGEPIELGDTSSPTTVSVTVDTDSDLIAELQLEHTLTGAGDPVTYTTDSTVVHPDPFSVPGDHDPERLQTVIDFVAEDTTIELDGDTTFTETVDDTQPTAIEIDRFLTVRGDGGTPTIAIDDQTTTESGTGIVVSAVNANLENLAVEGPVDTGITLSGTDAEIHDVAVTDAGTGIEITDGEAVTDSTFTGVDTGIAVEGSITDLQEPTVTDAETGIAVDAFIDTFTDPTVEADQGIVLSGVDDVTVERPAVEATQTAVAFEGTTTQSAATDATVTSGDLVFGTADRSSNEFSGEYIDRPVEISGTNTRISPTDEPVPFPEFGHIGAFYDLTATAEGAATDFEIGYDEADARSVDEETLQLYRLADGNETWTPIADSTVDTETRTVSGSVNEYSTIAAYGDGVPYFAIDELVSVSQIQPGDRFDVFATIENQGAVAGTDTALYEFDGALADTADLDLGPGDSELVVLEYVTDETLADGDYGFSVTTANEAVTDTVTIDANAPAADIHTDARIVDTDIFQDESLAVDVDLENRGDGDGTVRLTLTADGEEIGDRVVLLEAGETDTISFTHQFAETGSYEIAVNDEVIGTVTVSEREEDTSVIDDATPGFGPGVALTAVLITAWLLVRQQ